MGNPVPLTTIPYQEGNPLTLDLAGKMDFTQFISPGFPFSTNVATPDNTWKSYRFGFGGPQPDPPELSQTPSESRLPESPEQAVKTDAQHWTDYMRWLKEYEDNPEVLARRNKAALDLMNSIGEKQMEYGWKSNLIGFALKELPRLMTEPARRRNRYLDDMVLNAPNIRQNAANLFAGGSTGNYTMGI